MYAVNLLTGVALCNGQDPSHLPESIKNDDVYKAVFPNITFHVTPKVTGDQVTYRTVHAIKGCFYSWRVDRERLVVTETCDDQTLELLPCACPTLCMRWGHSEYCFVLRLCQNCRLNWSSQHVIRFFAARHAFMHGASTQSCPSTQLMLTVRAPLLD